MLLEPIPVLPPPVTGPSAPSRGGSLEPSVRRAFGSLLPLLDDPELRDILLHVRDGVGELWLDRDGRAERVRDWRAPPETVRRFAVEVIAAGGRRLDELHPCADAHIGGGIRVHAVLPPVSLDGAAVSIRLPRPAPLDFARAVAAGLCGAVTAERLRDAVARKHSVLITGGAGTGKTTLLAMLLDLVPSHERIVVIEDLAELRLSHPHRIVLEARPANAEGVGEVSVDRLLREALRMRPDRLVLGECRGAEIATLLAALNTGHEGGGGTLHANGLHDVPARLEALGALAGMDAAVLARQAVSAFRLVIHLEHRPGERHRVSAVGRLELRDGRLAVTDDGTML